MVSAIIVIILILMIVVALAGLSYTFFSGIFTSTTETTEKSIERTTTKLLANMKIESMSINDVYVRNTGQTDLTGISIYVNDELADFNMSPPVVEPGETGKITIYNFIKEGDEIKITASEGALATKKSPDPCDYTVLCLTFDDISGNIIPDHSPYGNDGTIMMAAIIGEGKYGNALYSLIPSVGYVDCGNDTSLNITDEISIEAWIWAGWSGSRTIISKARMEVAPGEWSGYELILQNPNNSVIYLYDGSNAHSNIAPDALTPGWHHVVGTYDKNYIRIYVDGIEKTSPTSYSGIIKDNSEPVLIGATPYWGGSISHFSFSKIDEVRIYNKAIY